MPTNNLYQFEFLFNYKLRVEEYFEYQTSDVVYITPCSMFIGWRDSDKLRSNYFTTTRNPETNCFHSKSLSNTENLLW